MDTADENRRNLENASAEVRLSSDAVMLQKSVQAVRQAPDDREDVVNAIKQQLEAGTYQVDVKSLANTLLPFMK